MIVKPCKLFIASLITDMIHYAFILACSFSIHTDGFLGWIYSGILVILHSVYIEDNTTTTGVAVIKNYVKAKFGNSQCQQQLSCY